MVLAALMLVVVLSIAAIVVDYGMIMVSRTELSKAVDAGALAGAQDLPNQGSARTIATNFVTLNVNQPHYGTAIPTISFPSANTVRVRATMNSPSLFAKVLSLTDFPVAATAEATRLDPDVAIIIDRSGSMCHDSHPSGGCPTNGPWQPFTTVQQVAKAFVDEIPGTPVFTLISFSTTAHLDIALTSNRTAVKAAIDGLRPNGGTDIAAGLNAAIDQLLTATGNPPELVVLLTDGKSNTVNGHNVGESSPLPAEALIAAANRAHDEGIIVYGINYGSQTDDALMSQVAQITEGAFYKAPNTASLAGIYADIAAKAHIRLTFVN